ncbi:hypothetical protein [Paenibacillus eucommiae]|uniref:DUF3679 domain-containing protein n=1 Tax=Paenibacillus eucommiae TaxID=1355755 RepID=A0ABS4IZ64_9BACL|nr:hypothetical protein [Paenibacillus eucommiae]MBP1992883.1 hypothetical protein [Paenibacillus eucommiae]
MAHFYLKIIGFGLLFLFCIFFGVSLATTGMERIQGPLPVGSFDAASSKSDLDAGSKTKAQSKAKSEADAKKKAEAQANAQAKADKAAKQDAQSSKDSGGKGDRSLNLVGNKLGELLQIMAHHGIKWFISIFDAVLGKG